ncbi:MAG: DUF1287 domain-containing protein [Clostridia bacterium]|nr:DUF1287 domain-containing protein [Clostridia bacterium]
MKKKILWAIVIVFLVFVLSVMWYYNLLPKKTYTAEYFDIDTVKSTVDLNGNGVDDYRDIMLGARLDAKNRPKYDGAYQAGGYPPDNIGVCTDVVWRAFKNAGYCLKDMVDKDVEKRLDDYTNIEKPDKNIDFRRVKNLRVFFEEYSISFTLDIEKVADWQPGDIVIFGNDKHIGIVSDKRNRKGQPYIIHNGGQPNREEDFLWKSEVTGHYRFDASKIDDEVIVSWQ